MLSVKDTIKYTLSLSSVLTCNACNTGHHSIPDDADEITALLRYGATLTDKFYP